jgi:hypothetical protein
MPTVLRRSGPDFIRNGAAVTPRAMIHFCEDCNFEGAAYGIRQGGKLLSYCGWVDSAPACIRMGAAPADLLGRVA